MASKVTRLINNGLVKIRNAESVGTEEGANIDSRLTALEASLFLIGTIYDYSGFVLPDKHLWVPVKPKAISRTTYNDLWVAYGQVDWYAPDAATATSNAGSNLFNIPTVDDAYLRTSQQFTVTSVLNSLYLTLEDRDNNSVTTSDLRDGTPVRFYSTISLPGGVTDAYTTYYLHWDSGNSGWSVHTTEDNAISGTSGIAFADAGTGTVYLTQRGISVDDAFQGHHFTLAVKSSNKLANAGSNYYSVAMQDSYETGDPVTDGTNGTPRTSNETRPRTGYMSKIIRVLK